MAGTRAGVQPPASKKMAGGQGKSFMLGQRRCAHQQERPGMSLLMPKLALATRRRGPMLSIDNTLKLPKIAVHRIKHDFKILNF